MRKDVDVCSDCKQLSWALAQARDVASRAEFDLLRAKVAGICDSRTRKQGKVLLFAVHTSIHVHTEMPSPLSLDINVFGGMQSSPVLLRGFHGLKGRLAHDVSDRSLEKIYGPHHAILCKLPAHVNAISFFPALLDTTPKVEENTQTVKSQHWMDLRTFGVTISLGVSSENLTNVFRGLLQLLCGRR